MTDSQVILDNFYMTYFSIQASRSLSEKRDLILVLISYLDNSLFELPQNTSVAKFFLSGLGDDIVDKKIIVTLEKNVWGKILQQVLKLIEDLGKRDIDEFNKIYGGIDTMIHDVDFLPPEYPRYKTLKRLREHLNKNRGW